MLFEEVDQRMRRGIVLDRAFLPACSRILPAT